MSSPRVLRAVGYWRSESSGQDGETWRVDPRVLVDPDWRAEDRERIAAYLEAGWTFVQWRGLSHCRFACGVEIRDMGSRCLTDGEWVWPEGLSHYVVRHLVRLPDEFVRSMESRAWQIPAAASEVVRATHGEPDGRFWIGWCRDVVDRKA